MTLLRANYHHVVGHTKYYVLVTWRGVLMIGGGTGVQWKLFFVTK